MNYVKKSFILLILFLQNTLLAFDNEIVITGRVLDGVSIDTMMLSKDKNNIFLFTNSKLGARISVKELYPDKKIKKINILNNGQKESLPLIYELFNTPSFLGTSPIKLNNITLGIDISAH